MQGVEATNIKNNTVKLENNAVFKKSVSWAEDEVLVELHEIESHRRRSLYYRILNFCCRSTEAKEWN